MTLPTITATGNLGADPELKFTPSGKQALNFRVGCNENRRREDGTWETVGTTWIGVTLWGDEAERYADLLHRGDQVIVTGLLVVREYERQDGIKGTAVEVKHPRVGLVSKQQASRPAPEGGNPWDTQAQAEAPF